MGSSHARNSTRVKAAQPAPKIPTAKGKRTDLVASRDQIPKELLDTSGVRDIRRSAGAHLQIGRHGRRAWRQLAESNSTVT